MESYFFWTKEKNQKISFFFEGIEGEFLKKYPSENRRRRKFLQLIVGTSFKEEEEFFFGYLIHFFETLLSEHRRRRKSSQLITGTPFTDEEEIFFGEPTPSEKNKKIIYFFSQEAK